VRRIICSWQEFSLLMRDAARRLHVNDVPHPEFPLAPHHQWNLTFHLTDKLSQNGRSLPNEVSLKPTSSDRARPGALHSQYPSGIAAISRCII
jgi:hypothetical protein